MRRASKEERPHLGWQSKKTPSGPDTLCSCLGESTHSPHARHVVGCPTCLLPVSPVGISAGHVLLPSLGVGGWEHWYIRPSRRCYAGRTGDDPLHGQATQIFVAVCEP